MPQAAFPLAILGGLHLEQITDLAWSLDGNTLAISSYDSYCRSVLPGCQSGVLWCRSRRPSPWRHGEKLTKIRDAATNGSHSTHDSRLAKAEGGGLAGLSTALQTERHKLVSGMIPNSCPSKCSFHK